jgi:hypothetical protein
LRSAVNVTITASWAIRVVSTLYVGRGVGVTWTRSLLTRVVTSPPTRWNVRLKVSSPTWVHRSAGDGLGHAAGGGGGLGGGVGDGDGLGEGDGLGDGDGDGAAARNCAADSGAVRLGAAAIRTDRMPSQEIPTVIAVANVQAAR